MSDVPLREHFEKQLKLLLELAAERDRRYNERFEAQEKARQIYAENLEAWKDHANNFREQLNEERRTFMTKSMGAVIAALTIVLLLVQLARIIFARIIT